MAGRWKVRQYWTICKRVHSFLSCCCKRATIKYKGRWLYENENVRILFIFFLQVHWASLNGRAQSYWWKNDNENENKIEHQDKNESRNQIENENENKNRNEHGNENENWNENEIKMKMRMRSDGDRTEWSTIQGKITQVISNRLSAKRVYELKLRVWFPEMYDTKSYQQLFVSITKC